ncbi:hypothetical protein DPMN_180266 [Dreissena polymorpha]|uniref:Uncharacterized protein n=1 Tax=Dreissena polymorpha TaxID=45954 RepID=A0A9D4EFZ0_DREPO|nr:hypothetical protein DPMN_180266 [Dreissena polymorpha]
MSKWTSSNSLIAGPGTPVLEVVQDDSPIFLHLVDHRENCQKKHPIEHRDRKHLSNGA